MREYDTMEVKVIEISKSSIKVNALCETEFGNVSLLWMGTVPILNRIYDVELENPNVLEWNKNITHTKENTTICSGPDGVTIIGNLDSLDSDGYMTLRLGKSIIAFMTMGIPFERGDRIKVKIDSLKAYPVIY